MGRGVGERGHFVVVVADAPEPPTANVALRTGTAQSATVGADRQAWNPGRPSERHSLGFLGGGDAAPSPSPSARGTRSCAELGGHAFRCESGRRTAPL